MTLNRHILLCKRYFMVESLFYVDNKKRQNAVVLRLEKPMKAVLINVFYRNLMSVAMQAMHLLYRNAHLLGWQKHG